MKTLKPYNANGVLLYDHPIEELFDAVTALVYEITRPLVGKMDFRDLYDLMRDAAATAVGRHLCNKANGHPGDGPIDDLLYKTKSYKAWRKLARKQLEPLLKKLMKQNSSRARFKKIVKSAGERRRLTR